jgi:DNA-binding transcriptional ArsR family regulator
MGRQRGQLEMKITLPDGGRAAVRIHISPYWTALASVFEVLGEMPRGCPERWIAHVRSAIDGLDLAPLLPLVGTDGVHVLPVLVPITDHTTPTIDDELAEIRAIPEDVVHASLAAEYGSDVPAVYEPYRADPGAALARHCATFRAYWERVFAALWPRMETALEREAILLGHALATEGLDGVLTRVHPRIAVADGRLRIQRCIRELDADLRGRRISLLPMICGDDAIMTEVDRDDVVAIGYGTPQLGELWDELTGHELNEALQALLGESRARILLALDSPVTTTHLAMSLHLSAGTVSHHLAALARADLVSGIRLRNRVYYRLTSRGRRLRDLYTED